MSRTRIRRREFLKTMVAAAAAGTSVFRLTDREWHAFKVVCDAQSGEIRAYLDDMTEPILTARDRTLGHGLVGVGSFDDTCAFDDLKIRYFSRAETEMSSSRSGQWMPTPPPMNRQLSLCPGKASLRRGSHPRGTLMILPSSRRTCIMSGSNQTSLAMISAVLAAEVRIPLFLDKVDILENHTPYDVQFPSVIPYR